MGINMGGKFSRDKGRRVEYEIRDLLNSWGFKTVRVPLSGASQGFKGDLEVDMGFHKLHGEVKARKDQFDSIYAFLDGYCKGKPVQVVGDGYSAIVGYDFLSLGFTWGTLDHRVITDVPKEFKNGKKKLLGTVKWVKDCAFLVLKNDRRMPIFIRFIY